MSYTQTCYMLRWYKLLVTKAMKHIKYNFEHTCTYMYIAYIHTVIDLGKGWCIMYMYL